MKPSDGLLSLVASLSQHYAWLGLFLRGRRQCKDVVIDGFSVRSDGYVCVVVVRGLRVTDMHRVVAFGRAEDPLGALRNVTTSILKSHWSLDKYATSIIP